MNFIPRQSKLRTLFILGRVSNLPTVWSNCLAGWWLGGGGSAARLGCISLASTLLYIGGMFLNDAFDAGFDSRHRKTRPIPAGAITEREVWQWGFAWMALGVAGLIWMGRTTALLGILLVTSIVFYDAIHKLVKIAPVLMGWCRVLLYLVAASAAANGVTGTVVWAALVLGAYVMGLSYLARKESTRVYVRYWPSLFLASPVMLAALVDDGPSAQTAFLLSVILVLWVLWALRQTFWRETRNIGYTVSRLLAGIALVDLLAIGDLTQTWIVLFPVWFVLALIFQRFIPAT